MQIDTLSELNRLSARESNDVVESDRGSAFDDLQGDSISVRPGVTLQVCHRSGRSPTIVFLHGGLGNRFNWRSQYEFVTAQGWEALVYDLAGHGQSFPYSRSLIGRHRRDLTRLLQQFGIHNPILCCHSYGVPLGLEWAKRHSTRALILVAGGTHHLTPWWEIILIKSLAIGGRHLFRSPLLQQGIIPFLSPYHQRLHQFFAECPIPTEPHPYQMIEAFWGYDFFRRLASRQLNHLPTLVVTGGRDPVFTHSMGAQLATHFQVQRHLHFPEAGHLVMAEFSEQVNAAITQWLETLPGETTR